MCCKKSKYRTFFISITLIILFISAALWCADKQQSLIYFKHLSKETGLSSSQTTSIVKDTRGFIWIGTRNGLNRFDGLSNKIYFHDNNDPYSVSDNVIIKLFVDKKGHLLIATRIGINLYDDKKDRFILIKNKTGKNVTSTDMINFIDGSVIFASLNSIYKINWKDTSFTTFSNLFSDKNITLKTISSLFLDSSNRLWIGSWGNGLSIYDINKKGWLQFKTFTNCIGQSTSSIHRVIEDSQHTYWITTSAGLFHYSQNIKYIKSYTYESDNIASLSYNDCFALSFDKYGRLWVGTSQGGINMLNTGNEKFVRFQHAANSEFTLDDDAIIDLFIDNKNILWAGTNKGLNYSHDDMNLFYSVHNIPGMKNWLSYNIVTSFQEDQKGNMWIGTDGGGLNYWDRKKNNFTSFMHQSGKQNLFNSNSILALYKDASDKIWIGGYQNGICIFDPQLNSFRKFQDNNFNFFSSFNNDIRSFAQTKEGHIWIATNGGGVIELADEKRKIYNQYLSDPKDTLHSLANNYCLTIYADNRDNIWIGTYNGLSKLDLKTRKIFSFYPTDKRFSLSDGWIYSIYQDSKGNMWFGTTRGLNLYDWKTQTFTVYNKEDGLPGDLINGIVEDKKGFLWISTNMGICRFDHAASKIKVYSIENGLQSNEFVQGSFYKNSKGEIFFGGLNGFSYFNPDNITDNTTIPPLMFTDLYFFDKRILPDQFNSPLIEMLNDTRKITLSHNQATMFSIHFLALEYLFPKRIRYRYKLEGYDERWIEAGPSRSVTFTNLDAGTYVFHLISTNSDGQWINNEKILKIEILPPFYKSIWAYLTYIVLIFLFGFGYHRYYTNLIQLKTDLRLEKVEKEKALELERIKTEFFTNITHEFRTSLTLILVPLQGLIENSDKQIKKQLLIIQKSANRLLRLVNKILDFKQVESGQLEIECHSIDLIPFIQDIIEGFISLASSKNIQLHFHSDISRLLLQVDAEKMDMVISNLLSNAMKFTPSFGEVSVVIKKYSDCINIIVDDSGPGIAFDILPHIFERFYHSDLESSQKGTGIGLTLSKEIVERHNGQLRAENKEIKGASFIITLPVSDKLLSGNNQEELIYRNLTESKPADIQEVNVKNEILLIIEDDIDVRECLRDELKTDFQIIEAVNGIEGFNKAVEIIPDLVICDIMMFEMDGLELCSLLKKNELTSHIPVILLTARVSLPQQIEGLNAGADDYITKPFEINTLRIKLKNQLETRKKLRERFSTEIKLEGKAAPISDLDADFINRAIAIVEEYLSDTSFDVEKFSNLMGVSKSQLLRKLKMLTNETIHDFIRSIRLKHAARLLKESKYSITEICYKTGFNYPAHFTQQFQAKYGILPKEYRKQHLISSQPV